MSVEDNGGSVSVEIPVTAATFTSFDAKEAFNLMSAEVNAFPLERTSVINTDIGIVVQNGMYAVERLEPLIPEMQVVVPDYDLTRVRRLRTCLLSLNYLQTKYRALRRSTDTELVMWLTEKKGLFKDLVAPLVRVKLIKLSDLDFLKKGNNHHALAYAVMTLADMLLDNFESAQTKLITREDLVAARGKANELFLQLGTRQFGPDATQAIKIMRRKNFSLACEMWDDLEAFVQFARRQHGDADQLMPALYPKRGPRKGGASPDEPEDAAADQDADQDADEDFDAETDETTQVATPDAADASLDLAAINQRAIQAGPVKPGHPGGAPFQLTDDEDEKK